MIKTMRVETLRRLSVWADGVPVLQSAAKINKPWQVFCYLLMHRDAPTPANRLIAALWGEEDLTDPGNVLKNTVYALRREFKTVNDTSESPILFEKGGYTCNPAIHYDVDAESFSKACEKARQAEGEEKLERLKQAADLYKGDFLPQLEDERWVVPLSLLYKRQYAEVMQQLLGALYKQQRYSELLAQAIAGNWADPLEEEYYLYMFRAMYALSMYRAIIPFYRKTERTFTEELGVALPAEIRKIYREASERINQTEKDIMRIKEDLEESGGTGDALRGPLYCTYDVFKYLYQMVARTSLRNNQHVVLLLLSLQPEEEAAHLPAKTLSKGMNQVKNAVLGGLLRRTDTMARYSKSQYIIMLSTDNVMGPDAVTERLHQKIDPVLAQQKLRMVFTKADLNPGEREYD